MAMRPIGGDLGSCRATRCKPVCDGCADAEGELDVLAVRAGTTPGARGALVRGRVGGRVSASSRPFASASFASARTSWARAFADCAVPFGNVAATEIAGSDGFVAARSGASGARASASGVARLGLGGGSPTALPSFGGVLISLSSASNLLVVMGRASEASGCTGKG